MFRSAAAVAAVCEACRTTLLRDAGHVRGLGKIASIARELSPIQVGATGRHKKRAFTVVGALRKARERVRWNEWFLAFDDGGTGWLGEGNGLFQLFLQAEGAGDAPHPDRIVPGGTITLGGHDWRVAEAQSASVIAAEGELPFPPPQGPSFYADLRDADGAVATLDYVDHPPSLYVGKVVDLVDDLEMQGLKAFTGWSDPVVTAFAGPEVAAVRALACPSCAAPISLHPAGQAVKIGCGHCGSDLLVEEDGLREVLRAESQATTLPVPLGTKGTLHDIEWEPIGALVRAVLVEGSEYRWTELLLWNPWRGFRWLVWGTEGHWMLVEQIADILQPVGRKVEHGGWVYRRFQSGEAVVAHVVGEIHWEAHVGDRAFTQDYVSPPRMLSMERTGDEVNWSLARYIAAEEVQEAFGVDVPTPWGTAPNEPNPWDAAGMGRLVAQMAIAFLCAFAVIAGLQLSASPQSRLDTAFAMSGNPIWVSAPFDLAGGSTTWTGVDHAIDPTKGLALLSLVNQTTGDVYDLQPRSGTAARDVAVIRAPRAGRYVARVEIHGDGAGVNWSLGNVRVRVVEGVSPLSGSAVWFAIVVLLFPLSLPFLVLMLHSSFENGRWANSDGS